MSLRTGVWGQGGERGDEAVQGWGGEQAGEVFAQRGERVDERFEGKDWGLWVVCAGEWGDWIQFCLGSCLSGLLY